MNEEWKSMFGSQEPPSSQPATVTPPDIRTLLCRVPFSLRADVHDYSQSLEAVGTEGRV